MNELDTKMTVEAVERQAETWDAGRELQASPQSFSQASDLSLRSFRDEAEIHAINNALRRTGWNRTQAARLLAISYRSLLYKIRRHNITQNAAFAEVAQSREQR